MAFKFWLLLHFTSYGTCLLSFWLNRRPCRQAFWNLLERMDIAGIGAFFSKLDINLLITMSNTLLLTNVSFLDPWVAIHEVKLGGRKITSTHSRCSTCRWAFQLRMINAIFCLLTILSLANFQSTSRTHSSNSSDDIQLFNWDRYRQGKCSTLIKHLGFCDFPVTKISSLSPKALPAAGPVKRTLLCFPQEHFWPLKYMVLLGKLW